MKKAVSYLIPLMEKERQEKMASSGTLEETVSSTGLTSVPVSLWSSAQVHWHATRKHPVPLNRPPNAIRELCDMLLVKMNKKLFVDVEMAAIKCNKI